MNLQTYYINAPKREFGQRSLTIQICQSVARERTVRIDYNDHGYNDHGYNEIAAITNEIEATFFGPKRQVHNRNIEGYNELTANRHIFVVP